MHTPAMETNRVYRGRLLDHLHLVVSATARCVRGVEARAGQEQLQRIACETSHEFQLLGRVVSA
jgi:hypothetical protein